MENSEYLDNFELALIDKLVRLCRSYNKLQNVMPSSEDIDSLWPVLAPEYLADAIEQAKDERRQAMVIQAKKSLMKKIQGYDVTETKVVTVPGKKKDEKGNPKPIIKEQTTTKKHIQPDTAAIIFTLTNGDPEHWRNRQSTEVTGKNGKSLMQSEEADLSTLSDEERQVLLKLGESVINKKE